MSSLDVLNAIGEAHAALILQPELENKIKALEEDREFIRLERDEAEATISRMKARIADLEASITNLSNTIATQRSTINELESRNSDLVSSLDDLRRTTEDLRVDLSASDVTNRLLAAENESLESRLAESRSFADKLSSTLKSIGRSIVTAVEVPEVTPAAPFPVSNPVELSTSTNPTPSPFPGLMVDPILAESSPKDLVKESVAPGCNPHPYWNF